MFHQLQLQVPFGVPITHGQKVKDVGVLGRLLRKVRIGRDHGGFEVCDGLP